MVNARATRWMTLAIALALAACATTSIVNSWYDVSYRGGAFKRIVVVGATRQAAARRTFEDIFAAKLRSTGIDAVPSYEYLKQDGDVDEPTLSAAVRASGADGLLMVRLLRVDRQTRVTTAYAPAFYPGYYGFYSAWIAYPDVYQYDIATAEVNLFDVRTNTLVWGGTTETFNPRSVSREAAPFANVIIDALAERGLVPPRPR